MLEFMRSIYRHWKFGFVLCCLLGAVLLSSQQEADSPVFARLYAPFPLPQQMSFAGEPVPLDIPDVAERMDRELQSNAYFHSNTLLALKRLTRFLPEIEAQLRQEGLPEDIKYVALAESLFGNVVSPAGAAGFWQLMPETARASGIVINSEIDERYHLVKATTAAGRYLKTAKAKFGSWTSAAASYNRGMAGLQKALATQRVSSFYDLYLNDETYRYIFRILALKEVLENPQRYGFDTSRLQGYAPLPTRSLTVTESIADLPQFALDQGINYKTLKLYNPWIKAYSLTVSAAIPQYELKLPQ
jgi:membrane-bound lytic murein transglycosylase D